MNRWRRLLNYDPLPALLNAGDAALEFFTRRDLLDEDAGSVERLWELPGARKILARQLPDGSWPRRGPRKHPAINYPLIETWREFRFLVERYGFTRKHPQAARAAEFIFSCQAPEGDIRGMLANQYATYYTGALLSLVIRAGYERDPRVAAGLRWLLSMRQSDGGWSVPLITHKLDRLTQYRLTSRFAPPLQPDRSKPFSHNCTGMVLRAFAVHPSGRKSREAGAAARLLKSRFFLPDAYTSYHSAEYWVRFEHPFWWNNLVAALDSISRIGISGADPDIRHAVDWLHDHQRKDGLWRQTYARNAREDRCSKKNLEVRGWIALMICRILRRLYG
jgi:hypothetical protein